VQRAAAIVVGVLMLGATAIMLRQGAFQGRVIVALWGEWPADATKLARQTSEGPTARLAVAAFGQPAVV